MARGARHDPPIRRVAIDGGAPIALPAPPGDPEAAARSEPYWAAVADLYDPSPDVIDLEYGYGGVCARPVLDRYLGHVTWLNRHGAHYHRTAAADDLRAVHGRIARALGAEPAEIALTRGAGDAMLRLIAGYNRLRPGDGVLYADLDYDAMQAAMARLADLRGARVFKIALPEPATRQGLIDAYDKALADNPSIRLVLLTRVSHRTGLVLPTRDIAALARARRADVLVDAAHAWGQVDGGVADIGADFIGFTLHKWIGAPQGVGVLYCRQDRIGDIDPDLGADPAAADDIQSRCHLGTPWMPAILSAPAALDLHEAIGLQSKRARLRYLRALWTEALRDHPDIHILTPSDPALSAGVAAFRLRSAPSLADNGAVAQRLLADHAILTVARDGPAGGACVRVTPAPHTPADHLRTLASALMSMRPPKS